jgi:transcriptional regulator with GAF, ATPase, and Fis domain
VPTSPKTSIANRICLFLKKERKSRKEALSLLRGAVEQEKGTLPASDVFDLISFLSKSQISTGDVKGAKSTLVMGIEALSPSEDSLYVAKCLTWLLVASIQDGTYEAGLEHGKKALEILRIESNPREMARLQYHMGRALILLGTFKEARYHLEDARTEFRRLEDFGYAAKAMNQLARLAFLERKWKLAFERLETAIEYAEKAGNEEDSLAFTRNLGTLFLRYGDFDRAREIFERAMPQKESEDRNCALREISFGNLHLYLRNWDEARAHLETALRIAEARELKREISKAHEFLGQIDLEEGNLSRAEEHYLKSLAIAEDIAPESALMMQLQSKIGLLNLALGRLDETEVACNEAIRLADALNDDIEKGIAQCTLGHVALKREQREDAIEHLRKSSETLESIEERYERAQTLMTLSSVLMGDKASLDEAYEAAELAHQLLQPVGSDYWTARSKIRLAEVELARNHTDRAQVLLAEVYELLRGTEETDALDEFKAAQNRVNQAMASVASETSEEFQLVATWGPESQNGFDRFLKEVLRKTHAKRGIIALLGDEVPNGGEEVLENFKKADARTLIQNLLSGDHAGELTKEGRMVVATGLESSNGTRWSFAAAPLMVNKEFQGLIYVDKGPSEHRAFHQRELNLLAIHAGALSLKIIGLKGSQLLQDNLELMKELSKKIEFSNIVTRNKKVLESIQLIDSIKDSPIPVLIEGDTGTGKELLALAIHFNSHRHDKKFVAVNCAAIPKELVESELFGHEKGAFTGAYRQKIGKFELADGGTLFLDEISEMDPFVQAKLLRVVEKGEFERVGGIDTLKVDVRVVAATNRDIEGDVEAMKFRPDLFYRLGAVRMLLPPLRERPEDIPVLVEHFFEKYRSKAKAKAFTAEAMRHLMDYDWPGNVRELENEIRRCIAISGRHRQIGIDVLSPRLVQRARAVTRAQGHTLKEAVQQTEMELIRKSLAECHGNKAEVTRQLGISYPTLLHKIKVYGLEK